MFEDLEAVAGHNAIWHQAGDGYIEPREAWLTCSCGRAVLWAWQQFYEENDTDPKDAWAAHLTYKEARSV